MARIYLDANVFISYVKQEMGWNLRGLFIESDNFFKKINSENHTLVLSNLFFKEVLKQTYLTREMVVEILYSIGVKNEFYLPKEKPFLYEIETAGVHYPDSLHVGIAIQAGCNGICTFNIRDFMPAQKWIKIIRPTEL